MSKTTNIQWCDSTVNPIMGCNGCELFPKPRKLLQAIDKTLAEVVSDWKLGDARKMYKELIASAYNKIEKPNQAHRNAITTTNIWHLRREFVQRIKLKHGKDAANQAEHVIEQQVTCYAAKLHLNRGYSILNPERKVNKGYAPTFEADHSFSRTRSGSCKIERPQSHS